MNLFHYRRKNEQVPRERKLALLTTFGHLIQALEFGPTFKKDIYEIKCKHMDDERFKYVVKYTSKTLKNLTIYTHIPNFENVSFSSLEYLKLAFHLVPPETPYPCIKNLGDFPPLKKLILRKIKYNDFLREIPQLEYLSLGHLNITDEIVCEFMLLNPQLTALHFISCFNITPNILRHICTNLPNIWNFNGCAFIKNRVCLI